MEESWWQFIDVDHYFDMIIFILETFSLKNYFIEYYTLSCELEVN